MVAPYLEKLGERSTWLVSIIPTITNLPVNWIVIICVVITLYFREFHSDIPKVKGDWSWYSVMSKFLVRVASVVLIVGCALNTIELLQIYKWQRLEDPETKILAHPYFKTEIKKVRSRYTLIDWLVCGN